MAVLMILVPPKRVLGLASEVCRAGRPRSRPSAPRSGRPGKRGSGGRYRGRRGSEPSGSSSSRRRYSSIAAGQGSYRGSSRRSPASCFPEAAPARTFTSVSFAPALRATEPGRPSVDGFRGRRAFRGQADREPAGAGRALPIAGDLLDDRRNFHGSLLSARPQPLILPRRSPTRKRPDGGSEGHLCTSASGDSPAERDRCAGRGRSESLARPGPAPGMVRAVTARHANGYPGKAVLEPGRSLHPIPTATDRPSVCWSVLAERPFQG